MSRERFTFRPSAQLDSHRRAWAYLQAVPDGQRNDFLVRAILRVREDTVLEEALRKILREELQAIPLQTGSISERDEEASVPQGANAAPPFPQEMMSFLNDLMRDE